MNSFKQYKYFLTRYISSQGVQVWLLIILLIIGVGLQLVGPQLLKSFIDTASSSQALDILVWLALLYCLSALITQLLSIVQTYLVQKISWGATNNLRVDLMRHALYLDVSFYNQHLPGEFIERIDGDVTLLNNFFSDFIGQVISNLLLLIGISVLLFIEDSLAGIGITAFIVFSFVVLIKLQTIAIPYRKVSRQATANFYGFLEERIGGREDIKANGAINYTASRFGRLIQTMMLKERKAQMVGTVSRVATVVLFISGTAVGLGLGLYLFNTGAATLGTVYLIYAYISQLRTPVEKIVLQFEDFQRARAGMERITELFETSSRVKDGPGVTLRPGPVEIEFEKVTMGYVQNQKVLEDISFRLAPGSVLGILGRTGSGKTTIGRLLARLYDPEQGKVKLGGYDLKEFTQAQIHQLVGLVTQDVQLFHATLRDNLSFFNPEISDEQIFAALKELGLAEWYQTMPAGLDTILTTGSSLSAGEAQLIAFARIFLKNPSLVILDEASSRLDPFTEQLLEQAISKLLQGRTAIIIAHKLATIERAEQIMILESGKIVEYGFQEKLRAKAESHLYKLLQAGLEEISA